MVLEAQHHEAVAFPFGGLDGGDLTQGGRQGLLHEDVGARLQGGQGHGRVPGNARRYRAEVQPAAVAREHVPVVGEGVAADRAKIGDNGLLVGRVDDRGRRQQDLAVGMELAQQVVVGPAVAGNADQGDTREA